MSCIPMSEFSAYLGRHFCTVCDLNSVVIFPKSTEDFTTIGKCGNTVKILNIGTCMSEQTV